MLYMFQTVFPSVIRSSKLHIQRQTNTATCCYPCRPARVATGSSNGLTNTWRCIYSFELLLMDGKPSDICTASYLLIYLLTPWCRVLLEKLTGLQLVNKFPAFYGTRRFITVLTSVRHLSLSWANPIQSTYPHPTSWRTILILSTHLRLGLTAVNSSCILISRHDHVLSFISTYFQSNLPSSSY